MFQVIDEIVQVQFANSGDLGGAIVFEKNVLRRKSQFAKKSVARHPSHGRFAQIIFNVLAGRELCLVTDDVHLDFLRPALAQKPLRMGHQGGINQARAIGQGLQPLPFQFTTFSSPQAIAQDRFFHRRPDRQVRDQSGLGGQLGEQPIVIGQGVVEIDADFH